MNRAPDVRRVVLVVLDGLRPDAVDAFGLTHIAHLSAQSAFTGQARTVAPGVTAAAMATLLTGMTPARHGVVTDRFHIPRRRGPLDPLPRVLADAGYPTEIYIGALPSLYAALARRIASYLGIARARCAGVGARDILTEASAALASEQRGLFMLHWPDADRAGHEHGWMSPAYADAARELDAATGDLVDMLALANSQTVLIALADHGGGGMIATDHESDHPADRTIPIMLAGCGIEPGAITLPANLVDVPATILAAFGIPQPVSYEGRPLLTRTRQVAAAAA